MTANYNPNDPSKFPSFKAMYGKTATEIMDAPEQPEPSPEETAYYASIGYAPDDGQPEYEPGFLEGTGDFTDEFLYDLGAAGTKTIGDQVYASAAAPGVGYSIHEIVLITPNGTAWGRTIENTIYVPEPYYWH